MDTTVSIRASLDTQPPERNRRADARAGYAGERAEAAQAPGRVRVEAAPASFQARLNYDRERAHVYVEILDPKTGDVLRRLPPDQAAEEYAPVKRGGALFNRIA